MELQKGTCFLCHNIKIIKPSHCQEAYKTLSLLLPKETVDSAEFCKIQPALKLCPICYHKLVILRRSSENISNDVSTESSSNCFLCKKEKDLFKINNWPSFNAISEDMVLSKGISCVACSDCLFYLETKNEIKRKLFSKYPQLRSKPANKNSRNTAKWKVKTIPNIKLQLTPSSHRNVKSSRKRKFSELSAEKNINFESVKKLTPLKEHVSFRDNRIVKTDPKFLNQIPYVLINIGTNLSDINTNRTDERHNISPKKRNTRQQNTEIIIQESKNFTAKNKTNPTSSKLKKDVHEQFIKSLVVNVSRMKIEKYLSEHVDPDPVHLDPVDLDPVHSDPVDPDPEEQNLINKSNDLPNVNETEENISGQVVILEEMETSLEVKNKRKSVSFAEEKNVEIEYFEDESNIDFRNHNNLDEDTTQATSKKYNKGILKRDENIDLNKESHDDSEGSNGTNKENLDDKLDKDDTAVVEQHTERNKTKTSKKKTKSRNLSSADKHEETISISSDSDEDVSTRKSKLQNNVQGEEDQESKPKRKKYKPRPLSKQKKRNINVDKNEDGIDANSVEKIVSTENRSEKINISEGPDLEINETEMEQTTVVKTENGQCGAEAEPKKSLDRSDEENSENENVDNVLNTKDSDLSKNNQSNSNNLEENSETENGNQGKEQNLDSINKNVNQIKESEGGSVQNDYSFKAVENGSPSTTLEKDEELQSDNEADGNSKKGEKNESSNLTNEKVSIADKDITHLVNKYLIDEDNDDCGSNSDTIQETEDVSKEAANDSSCQGTKGSDVESSNIDSEICKELECIDAVSSSEFEKIDEIGITESDQDNISSLLSNIFPKGSSEDDLEPESEDKNEIGSDDGKNCSIKGRDSDDELDISKEKKKRKVTFCDDIT